MSPLCLVSPSGESERGTAWQEHLSRQINKHLAASGDSYTLIAAAQLCTVAAFAFVRSIHVPHVSSLSARSCSIGVDLLVANVRNKAAIELRFAFAGTKVAFVSAHFAPHEGHCEERCVHPASAAQPLLSPNPKRRKQTTHFNFPHFKRRAAGRNANYRQAMEHFFGSSGSNDATLFFSGDLNYRLSCGRAHAYSALQGQDICSVTPDAARVLQGLLLFDELLLQRKTDGAFRGFKEACINFYPTFKFDVGSNVYVSYFHPSCDSI